ncbi:hypothetical protein L484_018249 [Morus notabilis]|uniref:Uncharacterized protein n=1 Tax=Morus notabilis TaxID=981085 RepID=W9S2P5_9ROSA|nr:hypothetical protein L484_018249 [Morus notabilis]
MPRTSARDQRRSSRLGQISPDLTRSGDGAYSKELSSHQRRERTCPDETRTRLRRQTKGAAKRGGAQR